MKIEIEIEIKDLPEVQEAFERQMERFDRLQTAAATVWVAWSVPSRCSEVGAAMERLKEAIRG